MVGNATESIGRHGLKPPGCNLVDQCQDFAANLLNPGASVADNAFRRAQDLDTTNAFGWARLTVTVGTAATLTSAVVLANPRFEDASALNNASVTQIV